MLALILTLMLTLMQPCPTEDSPGCYWNAATMGNGQGHSYIALTEDARIYLP